MKSNICPICGQGTLKKELVEEKFEYKGESITIPYYVIHRCDVCNEAIVDKGTLKSTGKVLRNFKCKVDGLLTGDEIKEIRKRLNLTQELISEILGGGLKSFARYESGSVCQSRAMDNLLRILDSYPFVIRTIKRGASEDSRRKDSFVITKSQKIVLLEEYKSYKARYTNDQGYFALNSGDQDYGT